MAINVGILTVSDRVSKGQAEDLSAPALRARVESWPDYTVTQLATVSDSVLEIQRVIKDWTDKTREDAGVHLILSTGGTGFGVRDVTPEAVKVLLDKEAPGLVHAMISTSLTITPLAMLSRPIAGIRKNTIIITLPGSPKGCVENLDAVKPALSHAIELARGGGGDATHRTMLAGFSIKGKTERDASSSLSSSSHSHSHDHGHGHSHDRHHDHHMSMDPSEPVTLRPRESPYPMISFLDAVKIVKSHTRLLDTLTRPVNPDLVGYVLAQDVFAKEAVPGYRASIVDGYAVIASDGRGSYPVVSTSTASASTEEAKPLQSGQIARITTGAPVPPGADAVVMVEYTTLDKVSDDGKTEQVVTITSQANVGQEIREIGSDMKIGERVLAKGELVTAVGGEIGVAASVGVQDVLVYRKPIVAVLSSGNEVVEHNHAGDLSYGSIRDTNRPTLIAAIRAAGFEVLDLGIATDDPQELANTIQNGLEKAEVLISTGGVSMGELDLLKPVLERQLGATIHFGRVALKPGKPTTFATMPGKTGQDPEKLIFALPGNPVSAIVTFYLFVLPSLRLMAGYPSSDLPIVRAVISEKFPLDPRPEFVRAVLTATPSSTSKESVTIAAVTTGMQRSSRIMSVKAANGLLKLPGRTKEKSHASPGDVVEAIVIGEISFRE
ncbi:hypothetical protein SmJEL517_g05974 [Synchytrium microbalum]|uniref:MoaB/Mog domain-containing protein n=1 Tax=Synchytrium microbalum TaxID=1806994 RepID=A0A507BXF3_9FUNG|nr:uncharacterized protein SmJEL517_g05974 [Synchytrium microbalum]TPX30464.1 hypothetical protein SmJEL517_g05974 [Synchytrium microbalum]